MSARVETVKRAGKRVGFRVRWRDGGRDTKQRCGPLRKMKGDAEADLRRIAPAVAAQRELAATRSMTALPLMEVANRWKLAVLPEQKVTEETADRMLHDIGRMVDLMQWTSLADITAASVSEWIKKTGGKGRRTGAYLRSVWNWARRVLNQPYDHQAWEALRPPASRRRRIRSLATNGDVATWKDTVEEQGPHAAALVHCLEAYGWRPSTAARMVVGDIELDAAEATLRKLKRSQEDLVHPLLEESLPILRPLVEGRAAGDPLFLDPRFGDGWMTPRRDRHGNVRPNRLALSQWWRAHVDDRKGKGIYQLKYRAISTLKALGVSDSDIATITGHRSAQAVGRYDLTNAEKQRTVIAKLAAARAEQVGAPREHAAKLGASKRNGAAGTSTSAQSLTTPTTTPRHTGTDS